MIKRTEEKGITLIALVITIIIMLILAGVTISIVGGSDGLIGKAEKAVSETEKAAMKEDAELTIAAIKMEYYENYAANRAQYANEKEFIIAKLQTPQKTSRGATMVSDSEGNITYTYKGIATAMTMDDNGKVILGESTGTEDEPEQGGTEEPPVEEGPIIVAGTREDWDITEDGTITLFKGTVPADGTLVVPNVIDGIAVKKLYPTYRTIISNEDDYVPNSVYCASVKKIVISQGIEIIEQYAFGRTVSLESVIIPNSVTKIGVGAFAGCTSLSSMDIPNSVTSISVQAFAECTNLTTVNYGGTRAEWNALVANMGHNNDPLTNATVICQGDVVGTREDWDITEDGTLTLFKGTVPADGTLVIPNVVDGIAVKKIETTKYSVIYKEEENGYDITYVYSTSVKKIIISEGIEIIGKSAFASSANLTTVEIPSTVTSIERAAFSRCIKLNNINIPESVTCIGASVFNECIGLSSITIPGSVTSIGNYAFYKCTSLKSIDIPDGVTSLGYGTFNGCTSLSSITIPESVTSIESSTFSGCTSLSSINIPESVISIGSEAFRGCTSLSSINIPESVTSIGATAFNGCTSLSSITIPESVTSIGNSAFSKCTSLSDIIVEEGNTVYDSRDDSNAIIETNTNTLVVGCKNTTIPDSVITIGQYAFYGCTSLSSIDIPESVKKIESASMSGSTGSGAFCGCTNLSNVSMLNVISIGSNAFYGCTSLSDVSMPNATTIGSWAFGNCTSLSSIDIPSSVTSIGSSAFYGCTNLTGVTINSSTIASGLTSKTIYGYLINYATIAYIKSGLTVGSYVTTNFTVGTSDKTGYTMYVK